MKRNIIGVLMISIFLCLMSSCAEDNHAANIKEDEIGLKSSTYYSVMNCDTGRNMIIDGEDEFLLTRGAKGSYSLRTKAGKYLNFDALGLSLSNRKITLTISLDNDYEQYQILTDSGLLVIDNDKGETHEASIAVRETPYRGIESGWYFTEAGQERPLKVTFVGDSITCGVSPSDTFTPGGFRPNLSSMLLREVGRVVCVGSLKHARNGNTAATDNTTIDDNYMYRHEGHSGWVIHYQESYRGGYDDNNRGIDDDGTYLLNDGVTQEDRHVRRTLMEKYEPDVVFLMIGYNDIGMSGGDYSGIMERWTVLANNILGSLQENGAVIVGSVHNLAYNLWMEEAVDQLNDDRVVLSNTFTALSEAGSDAISSDGVHLNSMGNEIIANAYFDCFVSIKDQISGMQ